MRQDAELNEKKELIGHMREAVEAKEDKIRLLEGKVNSMKESMREEKTHGNKKR